MTLYCEYLPGKIGTTNVQARVWEDGVEDTVLRVNCNEGEQRLNIDENAEKRISVEFSSTSPDDQQILVNYTLTVRGFI